MTGDTTAKVTQNPQCSVDCPSWCSHLMWSCAVCSCEGGWGMERGKLTALAAEHVCPGDTSASGCCAHRRCPGGSLCCCAGDTSTPYTPTLSVEEVRELLIEEREWAATRTVPSGRLLTPDEFDRMIAKVRADAVADDERVAAFLSMSSALSLDGARDAIAGLNRLQEARIAQAVAYIRATWLGEGEPVRNTPAGEIIAILHGKREYGIADKVYDAGYRKAASLTPEPSEDVREALARAVFIASDPANADYMAKAWDAPGSGGRTSWHDYADAILARFDVTPKTTDQPDGGQR